MSRDIIYHLVFLSAPGSGKSTQARIFAENNNLAHIIVGELLYSEIASKTELGMELKQIVESGALVPGKSIIGLYYYGIIMVRPSFYNPSGMKLNSNFDDIGI